MPGGKIGLLVRKSERVLLKIPIQVEGKDARGNEFDDNTYTVVINRSGGQIVVQRLLAPGDIIKITNPRSQISCFFKVVSRAATCLTDSPEWAVKSLDPRVAIWGVNFPTRPKEPPKPPCVHALLECQECFSREMAALTEEEYRRLAAESPLPRPCPKCRDTTYWKCALIEGELEDVLPSLPAPPVSGLTQRDEAERRREKRVAVKVPLEVRLPDGSKESGTTENLSKSGLCFVCSLEMQVGDPVYVSVGSNASEEKREIPAHVVWRRPTEGKGWALYGVKVERGD